MWGPTTATTFTLSVLPSPFILANSTFGTVKLELCTVHDLAENRAVQLRFLLGPAGSGKTFRCLSEAAQALETSPDGPPLLFLAPKQMTYQLERQLLADFGIQGYSRLHILSFERLAWHIFGQCRKPAPDVLDEEGRAMVLRSLLARRRDELKLFRASARLTGFAQQLSLALRELQRNQLSVESLEQLASKVQGSEGLALKLQDLAVLLREYLRWLEEHRLQDADRLLDSAAECLKMHGPAGNGNGHAAGVTASSLAGRATPGAPPTAPRPRTRSDASSRRRQDWRGRDQMFLAFGNEQAKNHDGAASLGIAQIWVDGFAEWSSQELELMAALLPHCEKATLTFCLERPPLRASSWLSAWSVIQRNYEHCSKRLGSLPGVSLAVETLPRSEEGRFCKSPALAYLERAWTEPESAFEDRRERNPQQDSQTSASLRVAVCPDLEAEAVLAAREILRHVRGGGRFKESAVLVRNLENYHEPIQRVFSRYEIPFFLDRRESVAHHPLAELTRSALRTICFGWQIEDWFAALKSGLASATDEEIDRLENEALGRGWRGSTWRKPLIIKDDPDLTLWLADLQQRLLPPFQRFEEYVASQQNRPEGVHLASAIRELWRELRVESRLEEWASAESPHAGFRAPSSVHSTVWNQMNLWLDNVALAFPTERLGLREWLPILEAGLGSLTVGVIPPALDQVLVGGIDRSRNVDAHLALVLGLNETVFPAVPEVNTLLTESDRVELEKHHLLAGSTARHQLSRERHYAYLACTRARQRLVLTCAQHDAAGSPLNPSPFLDQIKRLFPSLVVATIPRALDWRESEHASELVGPILRFGARTALSARADSVTTRGQGCPRSDTPIPHELQQLQTLPALARMSQAIERLQSTEFDESLSPELAYRLYGPVLHTSVSRMEQFAACPFKFFVHSGLRAEERKRFELDAKEQGSFQHEALARFHDELRREAKRWRDVTPADARERIARIATGLVPAYRDGLFDSTEETRFIARVLTSSLQDFVETLVEWMGGQYQFDPVAVELPFGQENSPFWRVDLGHGLALAFSGRIDRVDLWRPSESEDALCVVVDYKSSHKHLDPVLLANGLQLQLLTYLNVLRHWPDPRGTFDAARLLPAGVFYVNLRGKYKREPNRLEALGSVAEARKLAYRHAGRFDARALPHLDARGVPNGDQFNYRLTQHGRITANSREALSSTQFKALLDSIEAHLIEMGRQAFSGVAMVAPYRKSSVTACDQCEYQSICRIDPWTHSFRVLKKVEQE